MTESPGPLDLGSVDNWDDPLFSGGTYSPPATTLAAYKPTRSARKPFPVKAVAWIAGGCLALVVIGVALVYAGKAIHTAYLRVVADAEQADPAAGDLALVAGGVDDTSAGRSSGDSVSNASSEDEPESFTFGKALSAATDTVTPELSTPIGVYKRSLYLGEHERYAEIYDLHSKATRAFYDSHAAAQGFNSGREFFAAERAKSGKRLNYICANPQFKEDHSGNRCTLTVIRDDSGIFLSIEVKLIREGAFWRFYADPSSLAKFGKRLEDAARDKGKQQPTDSQSGH